MKTITPGDAQTDFPLIISRVTQQSPLIWNLSFA